MSVPISSPAVNEVVPVAGRTPAPKSAPAQAPVPATAADPRINTGRPDALALSQRLRGAGLNVETQLEPRKLAKQMQYADRAGIRFVVIRGEDEAAKGVVAVKDLRRGEQFEVADDDLPRTLLVEREQARSMP